MHILNIYIYIINIYIIFCIQFIKHNCFIHNMNHYSNFTSRLYLKMIKYFESRKETKTRVYLLILI